MSSTGNEEVSLERLKIMAELAGLNMTDQEVEDLKPLVRRLADKHLERRLEGMELGQRVALARRSGRGLIPGLCRSREEPVLRSLLGNSLLVEADAVKVASSDVAPRPLLDHLSRHPRWGIRRDVRLALVCNKRTPVAAALHIVQRLSRWDLRRLCRQPGVPGIVRIAAERRLCATRQSLRAEGSGGKSA